MDEFLPPVLKGVGRRGKGSSIWVHPPEQPRTSVTLDLDSPEAPGPSGPALTLTGAAVLLDMATPLHCAALRGLPAAVEQLLMSGADITLTTAAGQLPLELVPRCQWRRGERLCQCQNPSEAILFDGCNVDICRQLLIAQVRAFAATKPGAAGLGIGAIPVLSNFILHGPRSPPGRPGMHAHL